MNPYSADLRERIAAARAAGNSSLGEVAARFSVSLSFVNKLLKRQRTSGTVASLPHRGGPAPMLDAAARAQLAACVAQQPDATLEELRVQLAAHGGPHHRLAGLAGVGFTARKKSVHAAERDTQRVNGLRRAFLEALPDQDVTRFKFVDEMSVNLTYTRRSGRAPGGQRGTKPCRCTMART